MTPVVKIDPLAPDPRAIARAAAVVARGGCVVFPTRGLYGLAADAFQARAVARVYAIKQRPARNPLLVLVADSSDITQVAAAVPQSARLLMARFWPGRLTLIVPARPKLPVVLTAGTGTIGVRQAGHPAAAALVRACGRPITGTSANLSSRPACRSIRALDPQIAANADLILDCGPLAGGAGSTIVDVTRNPVALLREGAIPRVELLDALKSLDSH